MGRELSDLGDWDLFEIVSIPVPARLYEPVFHIELHECLEIDDVGGDQGQIVGQSYGGYLAVDKWRRCAQGG